VAAGTEPQVDDSQSTRRGAGGGGAGQRSAGRLHAEKRERIAGWGFVLPTVVVLLLLNLFPLVYSILLSFSRVDTSTGLEVGHTTLGNWTALFHDAQFWGSIKFTVIFTVIAVIAEYAVGLALALLMRQRLAGGGFFRVLFAIPMMLAPVAIEQPLGRRLGRDHGRLGVDSADVPASAGGSPVDSRRGR
jgi:multiple sugar transport system permease protein